MPMKGMARGGIGIAQWGEAALKPSCPSQPEELGTLRLVVRVLRDKGQGLIWVKGRAASLPALPKCGTG